MERFHVELDALLSYIPARLLRMNEGVHDGRLNDLYGSMRQYLNSWSTKFRKKETEKI